MTYGPGADTCAEDAAGVKAAIASTIAAAVRGTASPPGLLAALRFSTCRPVLPHPHRHRPPRRGRHPAAPAASARHLTVMRLRLTSATKQLRKLTPDRCLFLAKLLEPRHRAKPCQPAQLFLIEICHASSDRNATLPCLTRPTCLTRLSSPCRPPQAASPATPARYARRRLRRPASRPRLPSPVDLRNRGRRRQP
jgi:hypothetical protein